MKLLYEQLTDIPIGFTEVEYLETINQQSNQTSATDVSWIDTGIIPNDNTKLECRMAFTTLISGNNNEALCGSSGSTGNFRFAWGFASLSPYTNFYAGLGGQNLTTNVTRDTNVHTFKIDAVNKTWAIDSVTGSFTSSGSLSGTSSIFLFGRHIPFYGDNVANKPANAKIYYCKIWNNGTLVRDFVPCLDSSNVPCLWDKVEGNAYYNAGTGTFNVGRKIIPVEYLESSGTQYIDLGLKGKNGYDFDYKFNSTRIDSTAYGIGGEWESNKSCYLGLIRNTNYFAYHYKDTSSPIEVQLLTANTDYTIQAHLYSGEQYYVINGTKSAVGTLSGSFESSTSMNLFRVNSSSPLYSYIKVYYLKIKDNGTLVRDMIPCKDENNVGYMFDKVTHSCFLNAGSGSFTCGSELPKKKLRLLKDNKLRVPNGFTEVEYIASDGNQYIDTEYKMQDGKTMSFNGNMMWTASEGSANFFYGYRSVNSAEYRGDMRTFFIYGTNTNPSGRLAIRYGVNTDNSTQTAVTLNTKFNISFDGTNLKVNGTTYATLTQAYTPANYQNMWLFNCNTTGYYSSDVNHFIGRVYNWQIWSGGTMVRDYIPCLDNNNVPCLWDKVESKAYYNQGTGTFSYGRKIMPVKYLESTGTQYIDTDYAFQDDFAWEIDFEGISDGCTLFGGRTSSARTALLYQRNYGGIDKTTCPIAGYNGQETPFQLEDLRVGRHTIKMAVASNKGSVWVDGSQVYNEQDFTGTYISGTTQALFADKFGTNDYREQTSSKVYALKMWQGLNLVRGYIPCKDENGIGYMFDTISHSLYSNAGTGSFIVGDKIKNVTRFL